MSEEKNATGTPAWRSPWVIGWLSLLVVVLIANGVMITLAVLTNPGLVTEEYYAAGRTLEQTILQRRARQSSQGLAINAANEIRTGVPSTIRLVGVDKAGVPVKAERVTLQAYRPADKSADFTAPMQQEGAGRFRADVTFPLKGIWDVVVTIEQGEARDHVGRRLNVLPR